MKDSTKNRILTFKDVLSSLKETSKLMDKNAADFDARMKKEEEARILSRKEFDARMKREEEARILSRKDFDERMRKADERIKKMQETLGGMGNSHGSFAEEYFYNSFEAGKQNFFGEKFDEIAKNVSHFWQGLKDEYDIVMYNHVLVALIEVKYRARVDDIPKVLKKTETFRILFPHYKDFKFYLALASMSFEPTVEDECIKQGIAIIKQVGDTVVINDKHLKVF